MGKNNRSKRKKSSDGDNVQATKKSVRYGVSSQDDCNTIGNSVSEALSQANTVLYSNQLSPTESDLLDNSVFEPLQQGEIMATYAGVVEGVQDTGIPPHPPIPQNPSNADIMKCLGQINSKLDQVDNKLKTLDTLQKKVDSFETKLKSLRIHIDKGDKALGDRLEKVENMTDTSQFAVGEAHDKIARLEKEKGEMKEELNYLQSQSMRNNLIFSNIKEEINETVERTEAILRQFMVKDMKIAQDLVNEMKFDRVHRIGQNRADGKSRQIVARFTMYKDREIVRKQRKHLKGTAYFMAEQFPKEISERRRKLLPKLKKAKEEGKDAWISYDTLYVNGVAVKSAK